MQKHTYRGGKYSVPKKKGKEEKWGKKKRMKGRKEKE
jgi:hypothetical protein